ncbi:hypothetical protein SAMN02745202_01668 [Segatella oulorum]|uniref:Uncharacterized protein n=1 Tax=Segatella oulorum TaxID=28136 RepID=A0A1T4Q3M5_9BACT|nr:hypothetical protein [Segatella oulorum]SJZ98127.1 hypothetical protein SAMN02745202_01668 [Segatella oulorum]
METPLRGRSGGHTGTAPTIPNTHRRSAKVKTKILMLAVTLQTMKCKNIIPAPRGDDKTQKTMLAVTLQAIKCKKQCSQ